MVPESEFHERARKVKNEMEKRGLDALVIYALSMASKKAANTRYLTNWSNAHSASILVLPKEKEPTFIVPVSVIPYLQDHSVISDTRGSFNPIGDVKDVLADLNLGSGRVGLIGVQELMSRNQYEAFMKDIAVYKHEKATDIIENLRLIKSTNEIKQIKRTAEIGEIAFEAFFDTIKPGIPAYKTTAAIAGAVLAEGAEVFDLHFGSGPFIDRMMPPPSLKTLKNGDMISVCLVHSIDGYFNQVCRTCVIGKPNKDQLKVFDAMYNSESAVVDTMKPGKKLSEIAKAGMDPILKAGFEKNIITRLGHGTGVNYSEIPSIPNDSVYYHAATKYEDFELKQGMAMILHSGILSTKGGGVYGDTVIVTKEGVEILSNYRQGSLIQI